MSLYTKLSDTPYAVIISPTLLEERLSASSYNNNFLNFMQAVKNSGLQFDELGEVFDVSAMIGWKNLTTKDYTNQGIIMLRVTDIKGQFINIENAVRVSPVKVEEQPQIHLNMGDIVYSKDGTLGIAAVIPNIKEAICAGSTVARIRIKGKYSKKFDSYFVTAFLNSRYTHSQVSYFTSGIAQPHITQEYIRKIRIPIIDPKIQTYIGDKMRLAEKCREEANLNRKSIDNLLNQYARKIAITELINQKQDPSHLVSGLIIDDRMDAEFYQQTYLQLVDLIQSGPYMKMGEVVCLPIKGVQPEYDLAGTIPALTGTQVDPNRLDTNKALRVQSNWVASKAKKALASEGEILFTVTGPPLGEAAVVHGFQCPLVINSHVARIKPHENFDFPFYLAALMNSAIVSRQVYRYCKGVRQKELYPEEIMQFVIPEVPLEVVDQINELGLIADFLEYRSADLIQQAMSDVERLIEGLLDLPGIDSGLLNAPTWDNILVEIKDEKNHYA